MVYTKDRGVDDCYVLGFVKSMGCVCSRLKSGENVWSAEALLLLHMLH